LKTVSILKEYLKPMLLELHKVDQADSGVEVLDSFMGCDLGNICAKAERETSEKSANGRESERPIFVICADTTHSP
jgi:hypothetical protein